MPTARIILGLDVQVEGSVCDAKGSVCDAKGSVCDAKGSVNDAEGSVNDAEGSVNDAEGSVSNAEGSAITDEMVKLAYLQKVRDYPPEQFPEKFRQIREAYELLKDEKSRLAYTLFHIDEIRSIEILSALFLDPLILEKKRSVPTEKQFLSALRESLQAK